MTAKKALVIVPPPAERAEREADVPLASDPTIGKWYWVNIEDYAEDDASDYGNGERTTVRGLWCITHIGTNFVELSNVRESTIRVHLTEFESKCTFEPNSKSVIAARIEKHRIQAQQLMAQVEKVTQQLGVSMGVKALDAGAENTTAGLALFSAEDNKKSLKSYKKALTKAKEKQLPELFEDVKKQNKLMARWMKAELLPWKAELKKLEPTVKAIESRIFNVELYAGLVEEVVQVKDGKPASVTEPLHLFQRRLYMDEESLVNYQSGGMNFKNLSDFDKWLAQEPQFSRILPKERSIVAFRIRNGDYEYEAENWREFIKLAFEKSSHQEADKRTFLYIRNGEQLHRLESSIDFGEHLFPDMDKQNLLSGQLYAKSEHYDRWSIITQNDYEVRRSEYAKALVVWRKKMREYPARRAAARALVEADFNKHEVEWRTWAKDYRRSYVHDDKLATPLARFNGSHSTYSGEVERFPWADIRSESYGGRHPDRPTKPSSDIHSYKPWARTNVYWDDVAKSLKDNMDRYNRVVLVLQGLFDRSLTLHPHPPVQLWKEESFRHAITLVYDDMRALVPGPKPDFEAYRGRLNASMKAGCVSVGQDKHWATKEAEKRNEDARRSRNREDSFDKKYYRPPGNPGPGLLAKVVKVSARTSTAHFVWLKKRFRTWEPRGRYEYQEYRALQKTSPLECSLNVPLAELLNVSAYTPGDFHQFFDDPRTRREYLKWAPLLLVAEDFHAGVAQVQDNEAAWKEESDY